MAKPQSKICSDWVLSVDPGEHFGAALFRLGELKGVVCDLHSLQRVSSVIAWALASIEAVDPYTTNEVALVIEKQFLGRGKMFNPVAVETLMFRRHTWELVAQLRNIPVGCVYPSSWQTLLKAVPREPGKAKSNRGGRQTKKRAIELATRRWPHLGDKFKESSDLADAALIGLWYSNEQMREHPQYYVDR